uniref:Ig-like domain-containing protein n=1 Tax=Leptobrachium leishanense TaxID=445787 RepID=A0A8C5MRB6_9ANUR
YACNGYALNPAAQMHLRSQYEDIIFTHFPQELFLHPGRTAKFTCDVSSLYYMPSDINWYKTNGNVTGKIADLKPSNERIQISIISEFKQAVIHIKNVSMDDSGDYHCQHVNVSGDKKVAKSGMSRLNVSGQTLGTFRHFLGIFFGKIYFPFYFCFFILL